MDLIYESTSELYSDLYQYLSDKKAEGKKIIAHLSHEFVPPELIEAAGAIPLNLIFAGNEEFMQEGSDYMNPTMCTYARSLIGMFKLKDQYPKFKFLNLVDAIISSDYCTSNLLIAESISKNFGVKSIEFFTPYMQKDQHVKYYQEQLKNLALNISEITNINVDEKNLFHLMKKYNDFRETLSKIHELDLSGTCQIKIWQKAILFGPGGVNFDKLESVKRKEIDTVKKNVILSGCPVFIGDTLADLIEEKCGGSIIYNDTWVGNLIHLANSEINPEKSPYEILADVFRKNKSSAHCVPNYLDEYSKRISEISKKTNTFAVINHIIKFCDLIGYPRQGIKEKLNSMDIKILQLERDYSSETSGQLTTRIEAFLEIL